MQLLARFAVGLIVILAVVMILHWHATRSSLIFEKSDFEAGTVSTLQTIKASFPIYNASNDTINIFKVYRSCTCTTVRISSFEIPPKSTAYLVASMNSGNEQGGRKSVVAMEWNERGTHYFKGFSLHCNVVAPMVFSPSAVTFGETTGSESAIKSLLIKRGHQVCNWSTVTIQSSNPHISAALLKIDNDTYRATVRLNVQGLPIGGFTSNLRVFGRDDLGNSLSQQDLSVDAQVIGSIVADPSSAYVTLQPNQTQSLKIAITSQDPIVSSSAHLETHGPHLIEARIVNVDKSSAQVECNIRSPAITGLYQDSVYFKEGDIGVKIPILLMVTSKQEGLSNVDP